MAVEDKMREWSDADSTLIHEEWMVRLHLLTRCHMVGCMEKGQGLEEMSTMYHMSVEAISCHEEREKETKISSHLYGIESITGGISHPRGVLDEMTDDQHDA